MRKPTRKQCLSLLPDEKKITIVIDEDVIALAKTYGRTCTRDWREILDQIANEAFRRRLKRLSDEPGGIQPLPAVEPGNASQRPDGAAGATL